jgi:hypothetical protein
MNIEELTKTAVILFENRKQIEYFLFLDALKTDKNKAIVEAVEKGFGILFEEEGNEGGEEEKTEGEPGEPTTPGLKGTKGHLARTTTQEIKPYVDFAKNSLTGVIAKFRKDPSGETMKMMEVIKNGKGTVRIKPIEGFTLGLAADYVYSPSGESTPEDVANAKSVLLSSALPHTMFRGAQIARTPEYENAGHDFIVNAIKGFEGTKPMPERLEAFISEYDPSKKGTFMAWEKLALSNLYRYMISEAEGIPMASKVWNRDNEYKEGDIVNYGKNNWEAIRDVPKGIEPGVQGSGQHWTPRAKKKAGISLDAPPGGQAKAGHGGEDPEVSTVGETVSSESVKSPDEKNKEEQEKFLKLMVDRLPSNEVNDRYKMIINKVLSGEDFTEVAESMNLSRQRVSMLMKELGAKMMPFYKKYKAGETGNVRRGQGSKEPSEEVIEQ